MSKGARETVIRGGLVVTGDGVAREDVRLRDGRVVERGPELPASAGQSVDAAGCLVLPGILDVHTHPVYLDDLGDVSVSGAYGGVTTVIHFAYAKPGQGLVQVIEDFIAQGRERSVLDFALHGGLFDPANQSAEIPRAVELGVTSFKMFMTYAKLGWMSDDYQLMRTLDIIASVGALGMVHAENGLATDYLEDKYQALGRDPAEVFLETRPGVLEAEAVNRAAAMAKVAGCPLYIPHVSGREPVRALWRLRAEGKRVCGETCPQYLTLTGEEIVRQGPLAKIGPPLRGRADQQALWGALASGGLDVVASDHAPKGKKRDDAFFEAPYGSPQVETMPALIYDGGVAGGWITLPRMVQLMCENPAKIFGLYPQKGTLEVGSDADLVVWDPAAQRTITYAAQHSNAPYTLYEGRSV
ncbi:MAG: amidohydrolase family protein, partial [Candidatus Bipolaricaulota bacterium]